MEHFSRLPNNCKLCFLPILDLHSNVSANHGVFAFFVLNFICGARKRQLTALPGGVTANYTSAIAAKAAGNVSVAK